MEIWERSAKSGDGRQRGRRFGPKISTWRRGFAARRAARLGDPRLPPRRPSPPSTLPSAGTLVSGKPFGRLMDCSRRTSAAIFSDVLHGRGAMPGAAAETGEVFPRPLPNTLRYISRLILSAFQKIDDASERPII